jgi:N-methylhydantoinase B/oxoprolinase/acetone carboxylase alpha subunit
MRAADGDGIGDEPIQLVATVCIDQRRVSVDLTECAPRRPSPTNATFAQTSFGVVDVLKCLIDRISPSTTAFIDWSISAWWRSAGPGRRTPTLCLLETICVL